MLETAGTRETYWSGSRRNEEDAAEDKFDRIAVQRRWVGQARDHTRFARYLFTLLSNRTDGTPHRLVRNGRHTDGVNVLEKAAHRVCASGQCDSTRIHEEITGNSPSKDDLRGEQHNVQMLDVLVRKYEEHTEKTYDNDLKLQRLYDRLPKPVEQQLVLEDRYGSATCESVKRRANN